MTKISVKSQGQYDLPVPKREVIKGETGFTLADGNGVEGKNIRARVPYINDELLSSGNVYVEYGRLKPRYKRRDGRATETRIGFYSPYVGGSYVTGRGYSAGSHNSTSQVDRPNLFQVTHQGFLAPELPRNAFYRLVDARYYNAVYDGVNPPRFIYLTPHMKGGKIHKMSSNIVKGLHNKRVLRNNLKDITHQGSEWYARLVIIEDGKVIQQGPISEPLFIERELPVYRDEFHRVYSYQNSSGPLLAIPTIGHKFKQ